MTVKPGVDWGEVGPTPPTAIPVSTDAGAADVLARGREPLLRAGDLFHTVGRPGSGDDSDTARKLPIDLLHAVVDGVAMDAVAHVVVRTHGRLGWWRGPIVCVMNVEFLGRHDVAPRAHPNDGRFDVVEVASSMSLRARWQAFRRLATGTHVPHPDIAIRRGREELFTFDRPFRLWVDGVPRGTVRSLTVSVVPDAAAVYV